MLYQLFIVFPNVVVHLGQAIAELLAHPIHIFACHFDMLLETILNFVESVSFHCQPRLELVYFQQFCVVAEKHVV